MCAGGAAAAGVETLPGTAAEEVREDVGGAVTAAGDDDMMKWPVASCFRAVPTLKKYFAPVCRPFSRTECVSVSPPSAD